jgi:hypothetical protein
MKVLAVSSAAYDLGVESPSVFQHAAEASKAAPHNTRLVGTILMRSDYSFVMESSADDSTEGDVVARFVGLPAGCS